MKIHTIDRFLPAIAIIAIISISGQIVPAQTAAVNVAKPGPSVESKTKNLAILLFNGVQIIDYTAPYEVFGATANKAGNGPAFNIYTVAEKPDAITTAMGMSVTPKYSFENAPKPDILLVPGGGGSLPGMPGVGIQIKNQTVIKWVQDTAKDAELVMSVCNGAFILAQAGLLDGIEATTTNLHTSLLEKGYPKIKVVYDKRFVDTGKIITTAGLSSGIDGALHVVEKLFGLGAAQQVALGMEYNWDPESKFVRANLADKYLMFKYDTKKEWKEWAAINRSGGTDSWENKWSLVTNGGASNVLESVNNTLANNETYGPPTTIKWLRQESKSASASNSSIWKFTDEKGGEWKGEVVVKAMPNEKDRFMLTVKIVRLTMSAVLHK